MSGSDAVLIQPGAFTPADLDRLATWIRSARKVDSLVSNFDDTATDGDVEWVVNTRIRDTQEVELTSKMRQTLDALHVAVIRDIINPFYGVQVCDCEPWQLLHYGVGGHYIPHVDAETLYTDDAGLRMWEKTLDRDLSVVYFLNDNFAGGDLVFPELELTIKPEAGTLVCFPSDHHYVHGVNPVTSGHRYTLVTWMRVKGTPSMDEINQAAMEAYHRHWPEQVEQPSRIRAVKRR